MRLAAETVGRWVTQKAVWWVVMTAVVLVESMAPQWAVCWAAEKADLLAATTAVCSGMCLVGCSGGRSAALLAARSA